MGTLRTKKERQQKASVFFAGIINFIKGIYQSDKPESSKRFFGSIGFICSIVFIAIWKHDLIETLLYVSATLIGLEAITKVFKK